MKLLFQIAANKKIFFQKIPHTHTDEQRLRERERER